MHLVNWQSSLRQDVALLWHCTIEATLTCPVCKTTKKFAAPEQNMGASTGYIARFAAYHFNTHQGEGIGPCENCGVLSVLPIADEANLREEILTALDEWLATQAKAPMTAVA